MPEYPTGGGSRAVFLSYAREDTDATRRIAEALRGQRVEVWFDRSELRGGDAWDSKIRREIKECALFVAIISRHTDTRLEGYFRREWKLAIDRTHDIAEEKAFILPVVFDDTPESTTHVPAKFHEVQWTRFASGESLSAFCNHVREMLSPSAPGGASSREPANVARPHVSTASGNLGPPAGKRNGVWIAATAVLLLAIGFVLLRPTPTKSVHDEPQTANAKPAAMPSEKSLAVLPFANRSADEPDASFVDGMHDDILTNLARIRELQVKSRTSVEQYRATKKPIPEIARELGVSYILEGRVQRAGNAVRITGQLIDARTDGHVWAQTYDRQLTPANLFAIQSELARAIAREMQAAISPEEQKRLARRPTENLAGYDLFLKARAERYRVNRSPAGMDTLEVLYTAPVTLDPNFGIAWGELSWVHSYKYFSDQDRSSARMEKARAAMSEAVRLAPGAPETLLAVGYYDYFCAGDYPKALEQFEGAVRLQPNHIDAAFAAGLLQMRTARWLRTLRFRPG